MYMCATIHSAMTSITGNDNCTSHQHEEFGAGRIKRDIEDLEKVSDWFDTHNPFDVNRTKLQSLKVTSRKKKMFLSISRSWSTIYENRVFLVYKTLILHKSSLKISKNVSYEQR